MCALWYQAPSRLGLELTFCPRRPGSLWQEYRSEAEAIKVAKAFNARLAKDKRIREMADDEEISPRALFVAKADTFRAMWVDGNQPHNAWCIEVNSPGPLDPENVVSYGSGWVTEEAMLTQRAIQAIYDVAAALDLHPFISVRNRKTGITREWPTGGGHLHLSTDLWSETSDYHLRMWHLERGLCLDYTNYPFIRWLWAQWFDDINSQLPLNEERTIQMEQAIGDSQRRRDRAADVAHEAALKAHAIKQRTAYTGKPTLGTYEYRFFDMPRTPGELSLQVRFLMRWYAFWGAMTDAVLNGEDPKERAKAEETFAEVSRYRLTPDYMRRLREDLPFARTEVERWFKERLSLDYNASYGGISYGDITWERAYLPRAQHGKAL